MPDESRSGVCDGSLAVSWREPEAPPALRAGKCRELWERIEPAILSDCGELSRVLVDRPVGQLPAPDGLRKRDPHRRLRIR
jgi:hypothetical protein